MRHRSVFINTITVDSLISEYSKVICEVSETSLNVLKSLDQKFDLKVRRNIPCYLKEISCGRECGLELKCKVNITN